MGPGHPPLRPRTSAIRLGTSGDTLASLFSPQAAEQMRVIYGGSVNPRNIAEIAADPRLDGVLAGATSINADNFANLVQ